MPKYYCDYCDTFLTHDSPSVRKTHNGGRKHKENVRMYYQGWMEQQAQKLVDATARAFTQQRMMTTSGLPPGMNAMMAQRAMIPPQGVRPQAMPYPFPTMPMMPTMPVPGMPGMVPPVGAPMMMPPRMPPGMPHPPNQQSSA